MDGPLLFNDTFKEFNMEASKNQYLFAVFDQPKSENMYLKVCIIGKQNY